MQKDCKRIGLGLLGVLCLLATGALARGQEGEVPADCLCPGKHFGHYGHRAIAPAGSSLYAVRSIQVQNALSTRMTLYQYDFVRGTGRLSPRGRFQLEKIVRRMAETPYPLVIETTGYPELDDARRAHVLDRLSQSALPVAEERVVVGPPPTRPADGVDAVGLHQRLLGLSSGTAAGSATATPTVVIPSTGVIPDAR